MENETKVCLKRYSRFWHTFLFNVPQISQIFTDFSTYAVEGLKPHYILVTQISQMTQILFIR